MIVLPLGTRCQYCENEAFCLLWGVPFCIDCVSQVTAEEQFFPVRGTQDDVWGDAAARAAQRGFLGPDESLRVLQDLARQLGIPWPPEPEDEYA